MKMWRYAALSGWVVWDGQVKNLDWIHLNKINANYFFIPLIVSFILDSAIRVNPFRFCPYFWGMIRNCSTYTKTLDKRILGEGDLARDYELLEYRLLGPVKVETQDSLVAKIGSTQVDKRQTAFLLV